MGEVDRCGERMGRLPVGVVSEAVVLVDESVSASVRDEELNSLSGLSLPPSADDEGPVCEAFR